MAHIVANLYGLARRREAVIEGGMDEGVDEPDIIVILPRRRDESFSEKVEPMKNRTEVLVRVREG